MGRGVGVGSGRGNNPMYGQIGEKERKSSGHVGGGRWRGYYPGYCAGRLMRRDCEMKRIAKRGLSSDEGCLSVERSKHNIMGKPSF